MRARVAPASLWLSLCGNRSSVYRLLDGTPSVGATVEIRDASHNRSRIRLTDSVVEGGSTMWVGEVL
jgi:hypothetical protein